MESRAQLSLVSIILLFSFLSPARASVIAPQFQSLSGSWLFALDRDDIGLTARWFEHSLSGRVELPGSLPEQGIGDPPSLTSTWTGVDEGLQELRTRSFEEYSRPDRFKMVYSLTPIRVYVGPAWYQRQIDVPTTWTGRRVALSLERVHWQTMVWVDGRLCGERNSLGTPHEYDLTDVLNPGQHTVTIRVDNRLQIPDFAGAHSVTDNTQGNWNGLIGALVLRATPRVWIEDAQVYPDVTHGAIRVSARFGNKTGVAGRSTLTVSAESYNSPHSHRVPARQIPVRWTSEGGSVEFEIPLGQDAQLWDEFSPALYRLTLAGVGDPYTVTFGMRELGVKGTQLTLNGRTIFLRGTLECAIFPRTGHPPMEVAEWERIFRIVRAHGLNHLRFHSWTPPEAAFIAADELGLYLQVEMAWTQSWGNTLTTWINEETGRILHTYGNHPSFMFLVASNEAGPLVGEPAPFANQWLAHWKKGDRRRLYSFASGFPMASENEFDVSIEPRLFPFPQPQRPVLEEAPQTAFDWSAVVRQLGRPVVSHETAQWTAYPDLGEIPKYQGGVMQPGNLEIFRDLLNKAGLGEQAQAFTEASGAFQKLLYKAEIEAVLRTPGMAGFQLLGLQDYPGYGSAYVGLLNAFWEEKGYSTAEAFRRFSGATVPLARMPKLVLANDEQFTAVVEVAHYGSNDLVAIRPHWRIHDQADRDVAKGDLPVRPVPTGTLTTLGRISLPLAQFTQATKLTLEVTLPTTTAINTWDFWVFPANQTVTTPPGIHVAESLDATARNVLQKGGRVLLIPGPQHIAGNIPGTFQPIFWSNLLGGKGSQDTVGLLIDAHHPALQEFPTGTHSDWQWWGLAEHSKPMDLHALPNELHPIVQSIPDWAAPRKLGLLLEARVGSGRLLLSSIDLQSELEGRPAARQFRRSLLAYMDSTKFNPTVNLTFSQLENLLTDAPR